MICTVCGSWARRFFCEDHHSDCPLRPPTAREAELRRLVKSLADGIRRWAADEDGVPDYLFDDYKAAVELSFVGCT